MRLLLGQGEGCLLFVSVLMLMMSLLVLLLLMLMIMSLWVTVVDVEGRHCHQDDINRWLTGLLTASASIYESNFTSTHPLLYLLLQSDVLHPTPNMLDSADQSFYLKGRFAHWVLLLSSLWSHPQSALLILPLLPQDFYSFLRSSSLRPSDVLIRSADTRFCSCS